MKSAVLKGHTPRTCKKANLNSHWCKSSHAHTLTLLAIRGVQTATTIVCHQTLVTASPCLKKVGPHTTPAETNGVGHQAEATLGTPSRPRSNQVRMTSHHKHDHLRPPQG
ncbi:hypothetical protein Taro_013900 [Colocasia esculenta]|uniref:Uncharacterized protein n=1 Tax=Colocasia esculenta TaxID=4460 RepID=A0A843UK63_COLES|nr:hypothetical protein [Colocasia esculenta]